MYTTFIVWRVIHCMWAYLLYVHAHIFFACTRQKFWQQAKHLSYIPAYPGCEKGNLWQLQFLQQTWALVSAYNAVSVPDISSNQSHLQSGESGSQTPGRQLL